MFWVIIVLEDHARLIFSVLAEEGVSRPAFKVHVPVHWPPNAMKTSIRRTTPKHNVSHLRVWLWGWCSLNHTQHFLSSKHGRSSLIFLPSDHSPFSEAFSDSCRCLLANLRQACSCAFSRLGNLQTLQHYDSIQFYLHSKKSQQLPQDIFCFKTLQ